MRALLSAESPVSLVRALDEPGADRSTPTLWKALADAGVFGLAIAEEYGGSGGSLTISPSSTPRPVAPCARRRCTARIQAALAIDQLGSPDVKAAWLPPLGKRHRSRHHGAVERPRRRRRLARAAAPIRSRRSGGSTELRTTSPTPTSPT